MTAAERSDDWYFSEVIRAGNDGYAQGLIDGKALAALSAPVAQPYCGLCGGTDHRAVDCLDPRRPSEERAKRIAALASPAQAAAVPEVEELKGILRSAITAMEVLRCVVGLQSCLPGLPGLIERSKEAIK